DTSEYSGTWKFVTGPPPAAPLLVSPPDSAQNLPSTVELRWRSVPTAYYYHLEVSGYPQFYYPTVYDTADTVINLQGLAPNIRIYWRVRAANTVGDGTFSGVWSFGTITPPQAQPSPESPDAGGTDLPTTVSFRWSSSLRATSYDFQLSNRNDFN